MKVNLFKRRCITMVTYARNQTWSGAAFQRVYPEIGYLFRRARLPSPFSDNGVTICGWSHGPRRTYRTGVSPETEGFSGQNRSLGIV